MVISFSARIDAEHHLMEHLPQKESIHVSVASQIVNAVIKTYRQTLKKPSFALLNVLFVSLARIIGSIEHVPIVMAILLSALSVHSMH